MEENKVDMSEIITTITGGGCGLLIVVMTLLQISPIKFNPWSYFANKIGKAMNGEIIEKVDNIAKDLNELRNECDEREADNCRTRILRFNDELSHDVNHSKEHFDQTLMDITKYEVYCNNHPGYKNNIAALAIERIKSTYKKCCDEGTFLV